MNLVHGQSYNTLWKSIWQVLNPVGLKLVYNLLTVNVNR